MNTVRATEGRVVQRGEGKSYYFGHDHLIEVKAPVLWEFESSAASEIPPHVHREDDEIHYLIEGTATYTCGDKALEGRPGSVIFLPRQVPHSIVFGPEGGRWLWLARPALAGLPEEVAVSVSEPDAKRRAGEIAEDEELIVTVFAKYGMDFLEAEEG